MKRRKRTSKHVPAKGRLRDMADRLWSLAVREDWANRCAVCRSGDCEAHHLIPRQREATRYNMHNGIALCARHHQFDPDISPHQNAAGFLLWLETHYPASHAWYTGAVEVNASFEGTKNALYYCDVLRFLRQRVEEDVFLSVVGVRFAQHLADTP